MSINDFLTLCRDRYSCRFYDTERPVADEDLQNILEAARLAPSACNRQPWQFVVVRDEESRKKLLGKSRPTFVTAPVHDMAFAPGFSLGNSPFMWSFISVVPW